MKHVNIPVFIPHLGCPHTCVFCNQRKISGVRRFDISEAARIIEEKLRTIETYDDCDAEIAFFGGSFTGIPREDMIALLELAQPYLKSGRVTSLRCSTRPDYIDEEIIDILRAYGMNTVELGIQSMSDEVLRLSERGHTAAQTERACGLIGGSGMALVGQMMTGLPGSTASDELYTAQRICELRADAARIYPTMTFSGTALADLYNCGGYTPPTLSESVERAAGVFEIFERNGVGVIRIGLCATDEIMEDGQIIAGDYEPAFGEMVIGRFFLGKLMQIIPRQTSDAVTVECAPGKTSAVVGHRGANKEALRSARGIRRLRVRENADMHGFDIRLVPNA